MSAESEALLDALKAFFKGDPGLDGTPGAQGPSGGHFPHCSAGWANFKAARDALATRLMALPRSAGHRETGTPFTNTGPDTNSYSDVTRARRHRQAQAASPGHQVRP